MPEPAEPEPLEEIDDAEMLREDEVPEAAAPEASMPDPPPAFVTGEEPGGGEQLARLEAFDEQRRRSEEERDPFGEGRKRPSLFLIAWMALLVFVLAVGGIAWFGREALVAQFPEAGKLYAKLGIETKEPSQVGEGLKLEDITSVKREVEGALMLVIEGAVVNVSDQEQSVPSLRAVITDAEGGEIAAWTFTAEGDSLAPGGRASFSTSTEDPERGVNLSLIFVEP